MVKVEGEAGGQRFPLEVPYYGASVFSLQSTGTDFTLICIRPQPLVTETGSIVKGEAKAHPVCSITMSPGALKDLSFLINEAIKNHETEYGTVNSPFLETRKKK
jgi:hypothetical protein